MKYTAAAKAKSIYMNRARASGASGEMTDETDLIISEGNGTISRETVRIAAGKAYPAGAVLVRNSSGVYASPTAQTSAANINRFCASASQANQQDASAPVVLIADLEASDSERSGEVIARLAELSEAALVWPEGISDEQIAGAVRALAAQNVILRQ